MRYPVLRGPETETGVFEGVGNQDCVGISKIQTPIENTEKDYTFSVCFHRPHFLRRPEPAANVGQLAASRTRKNYGTGNNCGRPSVNVHLFINRQSSWTFDPAQDPFHHGRSILCVGHVLARLPSIHPHKSTRAERDFLNPHSNTITYTDQQFVYPFDSYESQNTFVVFTSPDGSISNATFLPILNVAAVDASETFIPSSPSFPNATIILNGVETDKAYIFMLTIRRSPLAKVFTIIIFLVNWGLVVGVTYIALVAWMSQDKKLGDWALAAPVTIILTNTRSAGIICERPAIRCVVTDCVHSWKGILCGKDATSGEYVDNQLIGLCLQMPWMSVKDYVVFGTDSGQCPIDRVCLYVVFQPRIQASLDETRISWNLHRMRTENHKSPRAIYELSREKAINRGYWIGDPGDDLATALHPSYGKDSNEPLVGNTSLTHTYFRSFEYRYFTVVAAP
ncbi:hypothetical protein DFH08DRAFT_825643 [Mycena albidolilacea]|uniref:Integrase core domain-containing protein n=1 Tax=Mycena albidolilacea TaxID=1033008 RepID=A0AAD6Z1Z4_9AGAR|nr:hypothetical protein DFH08DRAFT_825643 [Mycena albidolilacea]